LLCKDTVSGGKNPYVRIHFSLFISKRRNEDLQKAVQKFEVGSEGLHLLHFIVKRRNVSLHFFFFVSKVRNVCIHFFFLIVKVRNEGLHENEKPGDSSPGLVATVF